VSEKKAVFIDIDNTIIQGSSMNLLVKYCYDQKLLNLRILLKSIYWYFLYKINYLQDFTKVTAEVSNVLSKILLPLTITDVDQIFKECFDQEIKPRIYKESESFLRSLQSQGYLVYFISSTIVPIAEHFKQYFGFGVVVATEIEAVNGSYTGNIQGPICYGVEKLNKIESIWEKECINLEESYAFSDHISDTPMLNKVGHPIVINPSKQLKKIAQNNNWEVRTFKL